jgi:hypothetical protein
MVKTTPVFGLCPSPLLLFPGYSGKSILGRWEERLSGDKENQKSQLPEERAEVQAARGGISHGNVQTNGGDFAGRDRVVQGDEVRGDKQEVMI